MPAKHIQLGETAHEVEKAAIRYLVDGLPASFTVYSNAFIAERTGAVYELDAVVAAPHAVYVVEIKGYRGEIFGNDNDWYVPEPIRSPLRLNRKTAQVLQSCLRRASEDAGRVWVEGLVFLYQARSVQIIGPASESRVHARETILSELQNPAALQKRSSRGPTPPLDKHAAEELDRLLRGADARQRPTKRIREYEIEATLEQTERFVEHLAKHGISGQRRALRIYLVRPLDSEAVQERMRERCAWEAQVLARLATHPYILHADLPFNDEAGICLPFEYFHGVSLPTWVEKHRSKLSGREWLAAVVELWRKVADAIDYAHRQGVVHRLLRPEVVIVKNELDKPDVRVTGFDLAKQMSSRHTIAISTLTDERLKWAAPEVVQGFSSAEPRSDQFGLGALLAFLVAKRPLFDSTQELLRRHGHVPRLRDVMGGIASQSLDEAVSRMLALRPADRFTSVEEAIKAVLRAVEGRAMSVADTKPAPAFDPENLEEGTRIGPDYEIRGRLGAGGLATVYAARHLVSGSTRALKVARPDEHAEEALRNEYKALVGLDHPNVVKVVDLSNVIRDRLTMVMERVRGQSLSRWLLDHPDPDTRVLRRYAEDLLAALAYLEERSITHKDIKPDNLVVGDEGLTLIDFSLAGTPVDEMLVGTSLYRDPALRVWSHESDRYAAALCLFELYAGRHAFDGRAPAPGELPAIEDDELEPPGLVPFFRKALDPQPERRYASAVAMRAALLEAFGGRRPTSAPPPKPENPSDSARTPLSATSLSAASVTVLRRSGIHTQGELVALDEERVRRLPNLGTKKCGEVLALRRALIEQGVAPSTDVSTERKPLWPTLIGDPAPVHGLGLSEKLTDTLVRHGLTTVGRLADATREDLEGISGVSKNSVVQIVHALQSFAERSAGEGPPASLEAIWARAARPLQGYQLAVVEALFGFRGPVQTQQQVAAELVVSQSEVSRALGRALDLLDARTLEDVVELVEAHLGAAGGILRADEAVSAIDGRFPRGDDIEPMGLLRLLARRHAASLTWLDPLSDVSVPLLLRPHFSASTLRTFLDAAREIARIWPLSEAEPARRSLRPLLPEYDLDPLALAVRLLSDLRLTDAGELFETPIYPERAILYALRRLRLPVTLDDLRQDLEQAFGEALIWPEAAQLPEIFGKIPDCRLEGDRVVAAGGKGIEANTHEQDPLPPELRTEAKSPEEIAGEMLRSAARARGYRLIVAPPEKHVAVAESVRKALGPEAIFVRFEHELLERMEHEGFEEYVRAERFKAQRKKLTRAAESLLAALLDRHGKPGNVVVVGDAAILGTCDALHLVRRLYDETLSGSRGFWALVVPGIIQKRQVLFNEKAPVFNLDGATLPLLGEIPGIV
ncbi:protein kinase domain-containing protein [Polyangium spumosum]|uniref:non-specific serine/threonine protein kinase n=1 Tax=Polyangium spumosum TaxID=889282 RepID=A0A6N7Q7X4_9BACT|nr:protein kinase [Polyangium spumosum]MRG98414.1 protein kinase [Polyangium spumosum]